MTMINPVPEGIHTLTPHLTVLSSARASEWYTKVFGAVEELRITMPGTDLVMHARLRIGDSHIMLNDEFPQSGSTAPRPDEKASTVHAYVEDVDALYHRAIDAGATGVLAPMNTFWGDRYGKFTDPFGHHWSIASRIEDLSPNEIDRRAREHFGSAGQS
ncbi:MAG: VOC family protein [Candidatus Zixiibacteriota bacterium]